MENNFFFGELVPVHLLLNYFPVMKQDAYPLWKMNKYVAFCDLASESITGGKNPNAGNSFVKSKDRS